MKKIWKFILTNSDTLIAILVSLMATIIGMFGGNQFLLLSGIAATLAILSISLIRDRINREALSEQISDLKRHFPDRPSALEFFRKPPDLVPFIKQATQIDLCGVTLTDTIHGYSATLSKHLENGGKLRILLIDPVSQAIEMTAQRSVSAKDTGYYHRRLESALFDIAYLIKFTGDRKRSGARNAKPENISVRLLSYAPSFGIMSFDAKKKNGMIFVEVYPHKYGFQLSPTFELTPANDKDWYNYFVDQFEVMWKAASNWDPAPYLQKISF
jgi:hypothetical protein